MIDMTRWYYKLPGSFYANGPTLGHYSTEREARNEIREYLEVSRLPKGTELWRAYS